MELMEYDELKLIGTRESKDADGRLTRSAHPLRTPKHAISSRLVDSLRTMPKFRHSVGAVALRQVKHQSEPSSESSGEESDAEARVTRSKVPTTPRSSSASKRCSRSAAMETPGNGRQTRRSVAFTTKKSSPGNWSSSESESSESSGSECSVEKRVLRPRVALTPKLAAMTLHTPKSSNSEVPRGGRRRGRPPLSARGLSRQSLRMSILKTPRSAGAKRLREKVATPAFRSAAFETDEVEAQCEPLACREAEFTSIRNFIAMRLRTATSGCVYVSGVPGTGKTATVSRVVHSLQRDAASAASCGRKSLFDAATRGRGRGRGRPRKSLPAQSAAAVDGVPQFKFVELNGIVLSRPKEVYVHLWRALSGRKLSAEKALRALDSYFTGCSRLDANANEQNKSVNSPSSDSDSDTCLAAPVRMPVVVLVDEIDLLRTRKQEVLYTLFDWPTANNARLTIVAIANLMNLPDTLLIRRIASRLGLARVPFAPYTWQQLNTILRSRVLLADGKHSDSDSLCFDPGALEYVARKVAAVSGDVRRALEICKFATEFEQERQLEKLAAAGNGLCSDLNTPSRTRRQSRFANTTVSAQQSAKVPDADADADADTDSARNCVTMHSVNRAIARMNSSLSVIETIRALPCFQKMFLKAVLVECASRHAHSLGASSSDAAGVTSSWQHSAVTFGAAYRQFGVLCHYDDLAPVPSADCVAHLVVGPLADCRYVSVERGHLRAHALVRLLVNADDLQLAVS